MEIECLSIKCLESPAGLPGAYLAQGAMEQNQVPSYWAWEQIHVHSSRRQ